MGLLNDIRDDVARVLLAAGVTCTLDPNAVPPFVLVGPPAFQRQGRAGFTAEVPVTVCVAPPGNDAALRWMLDRAEAVALAVSSVEPAIPTAHEWQGKPCPSYTVTATRSKAHP